MRKTGRIVDWNDNRGFGFIAPEGGGERVFVHIKAFRPGQARPSGGETVDYEPSTDDQNRKRAEDVLFAGPGGAPASSRKRPGSIFTTVLMVLAMLFLLLVGWMAFSGRLLPAVAGAYPVLGAVTFILYGMDKASAAGGGRRVPESSLHILGLMGGWPGALVAQRLLHHKTRKTSFQVVFWITVTVNLALAWLLTRK